MSTYLQLCQHLRQEVGATGTGPSAVTGQTGEYERIVRWIAKAAEAIDSLHMNWNYLWAEKEWTLTTGASGRTYSLGDLSLSGLVRYWKKDGAVYDPDSNDYRSLDYIPWREWRQNYRLGTKLSEEPTMWTQRPDKGIEFDTNPSSADTVRFEYGKVRTELSANADVPDMPAHFHRIIVLRAKIMYAEYEAAGEILEVAQAEYQELLTQLEAEELPEQEHRSATERSAPLLVEAI